MMPRKSVIKVGIIGFGYWGPNFFRNFNNMPEVEVVYVCDAKKENLDVLKRQYPSLKLSDNLNDLLRDIEIDALAIATPPNTHYEIAKSFLEGGRHVLLSKPMATTLRECEQLILLAEKNQCVLAVDHTFLFTPAVRALKNIIDSRELGDIYYFDSERINLGNIQRDVNVIWDLACHDISIINHLFGELKLYSVYAVASRHLGNQNEEMAHVTLQYENGMVAHLHLSWLSPDKIRKIMIGGSQKMAVYNDIDPSEKIRIYNKSVAIDPVNDADKETPFKPIYRSGDVLIPHLNNREALAVECENFVNAIRGEEPLVSDGKCGMNVVSVLELISQSIHLKREVVAR